MTKRNSLLLALVLLFASSAVCAEPATLEEWVTLAGNQDRDEDRLEILEYLKTSSAVPKKFEPEIDRLIEEIRKWIHEPNLTYFGRQVLKTEDYDFGVTEDSPLAPLANLYRARMLVWVTLEYGGYWTDRETARQRWDMIRPLFEQAAADFPENRVIKMYLGEPFPPDRILDVPDGAPSWAIHQREGLNRLTQIVHWWIDHRMQDNAEYGGGWGDDCEMWRWWVPVLIAFQDPKIEAAQEKFSRAMMAQDHMKTGYTTHVYDVEHTAEDSADVITPMMHLAPDSGEWSARALRLADLMENLWTGTNERGNLQFKSTYFSVDKVDPDPRKACDTVYHARAVQPTLLYWQRTGDERLTRLFTAWLDTWVEAAAREERGKPAGIIPSAIHWPDGGIGGQGENWWDPENHTRDPLYVWPSAMGQMTPSLLLAYHMTKDEKYLEPLRSMSRFRLDYLKGSPAKDPEVGSVDWLGSKLAGIASVAAKYRTLTGKTDFDELLQTDPGPYVKYRLEGDLGSLETSLASTANNLRINYPGYTSEVRYTDRVLRFPRVLSANGMLVEGVPGVEAPSPQLLYSTATGDPGNAGYFPTGAVRWLTPARDIAALVEDTGSDHFSARLFHFGEEARSMGAELYLLDAGRYLFEIIRQSDSTVLDIARFQVESARTRIEFEIPSKTPVRLRVSRE